MDERGYLTHRRPQEGHDHRLGLQGVPERDRGRRDDASGRAGSRGDRRARRALRRGREDRRGEEGPEPHRRGAARALQEEPDRLQGAEARGVPRRAAAEDQHRQDPAPRRERAGGRVINSSAPLLFALASSRAFAESIARRLGIELAGIEERAFEDGEHKTRPLASVRGRDVFVIQSLYADHEQSVNDKFMRLLFFIATLRDAGAARITLVAPMLCYARKDRRSQPRDPVTTRYVATLIEAMGADQVVTLDVHNLAAFQNAFHCGTEHLEAVNLFVEYFVPRLGNEEVVVVAPDAGGIKRAERFRERLACALDRPVAAAFAEKHRALGIVSGDLIVGDIEGRSRSSSTI